LPAVESLVLGALLPLELTVPELLGGVVPYVPCAPCRPCALVDPLIEPCELVSDGQWRPCPNSAGWWCRPNRLLLP
jgi:hypothetical protein